MQYCGEVPCPSKVARRNRRLALAVALLAAGCRDAADAPKPGSAEPATAVRATPEPGVAPAGLTVSDAGAQPRRRLTYAATAKTRTPQLRWQTRTGGGPAMVMTLGLTWQGPKTASAPWTYAVADVTRSGDAYEGVSKGEAAIIERIHAMFAEVRGEAGFDDEGRLRVTQTAGVDTQPAVDKLVRSMVVPFPAEPIGVGAKWTIVRPPHERVASGVTRVELTALDGDTLTLAVEHETKLADPGAGPEAMTATESLAGTLQIGLDDVLPRAAELKGRLVSEVPRPGADPVTFEAEIELQLTES